MTTPESAASDTPAGVSVTSTAAAPTATPPTATTLPAPTTTTSWPPYSFDGSVPPPELVNTGDDFDAILRSIDAYLAWLLAHHPDPELLDRVIVKGTITYSNYREDLALLARFDQRFTEELATNSVMLKSRVGNVAVVEVDYSKGTMQVINRDGSIADAEEHPAEPPLLVTLSADALGYWRVAAVAPSEADVEITL